MNREMVDRIVDAVLYEGYMLYPYRPTSVKNRQRWTFGGLFSTDYTAVHDTGDASSMQTECLILGGPETTIEVAIRFLQVVDRTVHKLGAPIPNLTADEENAAHAVDSLEVGGQRYAAWQEAIEREVSQGAIALADLLAGAAVRQSFNFQQQRQAEPLRNTSGDVAGFLLRENQTLEGAIEFSAVRESDHLIRLAVRIENKTRLPGATGFTRDQAAAHALVSTHTILAVQNGQFLSPTSPPKEYRTAAEKCKNIGTWPVLVGVEGETDTILSSPIILYDYPQVAPESPGDLFDATEIDEILSLRILALSDDEKREVAAVDDRARALLRRTEALAHEELGSLHGAIRGLRHVHIPTQTGATP